jgi:iron complex outermembrane receptor protein
VAGCAAQGVPTTFEQANTQITTFTGGNPDLQPEKSDNYSLGGVWSPGWGERLAWSSKLDFELNYFHYKVKDAIQAPDIQALLNGCTAGTITGAACAGFTRGAGFNLNPPTDFLANLGTITTNGFDFKANWIGPLMGWGQPSASLQATRTIGYSIVDADGNRSQRTVGVEVEDSAIPDWQTNLQLGWNRADWNATWIVRYISAVDESCGNVAVTPATGCPTAAGTHTLGSTVYNDAQVSWNHSMGVDGLKLSVGANNIFNKSPPVCVTCSLNGYDAGTYDLPYRFWYVSADYRF